MSATSVRPIGPADEDAYRAILEATSAEDRYCRFFHLVDHFDPEEIHRFVETRPDMLGVIAFEDALPLGAAHAALLDETSAELAIVVAQYARRRGVASALLDALIALLKERGFARLIGCSLRENKPFSGLAQRAGFHVELAEGPALRWVLTLSADAEAPAR
jgi:ribosomal protein S18 acetylase RimI-like enzyme